MKSIDVHFHKGNFFEDMARFLKRRKAVRKQRTFCWCPTCNEDLCSNNSFVSDEELVRYLCTNCETRSEWNFDLPAPYLIRKMTLEEFTSPA